MTRNGCAVAEGIARRKRVSIAKGARHWVKANRLMLEDAEHLERFMRIHYEELVDDAGRVLF